MAADQIDTANELADAYVEQAVSAARSRTSARLAPKGRCHNCDEKLSTAGQLFCDSECGEDYDYVQSRKQANRITV